MVERKIFYCTQSHRVFVDNSNFYAKGDWRPIKSKKDEILRTYPEGYLCVTCDKHYPKEELKGIDDINLEDYSI